ncbi:MAG: SDR family NAD(P)-dependent oxidoreductase [Rhodospirillales bacterium]
MPISTDMKSQAAIVTGGAQGIGYAVAEALIAAGVRVALWDKSGASDAAAALGRGTLGIDCDCADEAGVAAAHAQSIDSLGDISIAVANAGIAGANKPLAEYAMVEWQRQLDNNLTSVFLTCRAVTPAMVERGYGRVVVVSSIAGLEGAANNAAYASAKAGAIGLTKALGKELAKTGVLVNGIAPSGIDTPLLNDITPEYLKTVVDKMPIGRLGKPAETAALVAWLCSPACSFSAGAIFDNSGGRADY